MRWGRLARGENCREGEKKKKTWWVLVFCSYVKKKKENRKSPRGSHRERDESCGSLVGKLQAEITGCGFSRCTVDTRQICARLPYGSPIMNRIVSNFALHMERVPNILSH